MLYWKKYHKEKSEKFKIREQNVKFTFIQYHQILLMVLTCMLFKNRINRSSIGNIIMCTSDFIFIGTQTPIAALIPGKNLSAAPLHVLMNNNYIKNGKYDLQLLLIAMISK